ncbi:hypothetical protein DFH06DRAFT_1329800 [Mycena polygramma]|nr:hypothetical protein DFH06DRAFT_1329800 [Mycena polygramma]
MPFFFSILDVPRAFPAPSSRLGAPFPRRLLDTNHHQRRPTSVKQELLAKPSRLTLIPELLTSFKPKSRLTSQRRSQNHKVFDVFEYFWSLVGFGREGYAGRMALAFIVTSIPLTPTHYHPSISSGFLCAHRTDCSLKGVQQIIKSNAYLQRAHFISAQGLDLNCSDNFVANGLNFDSVDSQRRFTDSHHLQCVPSPWASLGFGEKVMRALWLQTTMNAETIFNLDQSSTIPKLSHARSDLYMYNLVQPRRRRLVSHLNWDWDGRDLTAGFNLAYPGLQRRDYLQIVTIIFPLTKPWSCSIFVSTPCSSSCDCPVLVLTSKANQRGHATPTQHGRQLNLNLNIDSTSTRFLVPTFTPALGFIRASSFELRVQLTSDSDSKLRTFAAFKPNNDSELKLALFNPVSDEAFHPTQPNPAPQFNPYSTLNTQYLFGSLEFEESAETLYRRHSGVGVSWRMCMRTWMTWEVWVSDQRACVRGKTTERQAEMQKQRHTPAVGVAAPAPAAAAT